MATEKEAIARTNKHGIRIDRKKVTHPEKLIDVCPAKALTVSGSKLGVNDLLHEVEKDTPFYSHGGGVTLSGGEPLSQGEELTSLLRELKHKNISVNIETSLHVNWSQVERCIDLTDTFLVDMKHTDKDKFTRFTRGDAALVMNNLVKLTESAARIIIRIPVIPGFNHSEKEMKQIIDFIHSLNRIHTIHFLPYHTFGVEKYKMLGMKYIFGPEKPVRDDELTTYIHYAQSKGFQTKIGG